MITIKTAPCPFPESVSQNTDDAVRCAFHCGNAFNDYNTAASMVSFPCPGLTLYACAMEQVWASTFFPETS